MPGRFGAVATAMATPFDDEGALDLDGAQTLASHLLDNGTETIVVAGTTGESPTLTHDEKDDLFRAVAGGLQHLRTGTATTLADQRVIENLLKLRSVDSQQIDVREFRDFLLTQIGPAFPKQQVRRRK